MFKYLILVMVIAGLSQAQKSFYAGQQSWYPKVLAKYRTTTTTSTTPASLDNRVGDNNLSSAAENPSPTPLDPETDYDRFIQRVSSWPVDKQPFWYKNREAIWAMINQGVYGGNTQQPSGAGFNNPRSPFAGRGGK